MVLAKLSDVNEDGKIIGNLCEVSCERSKCDLMDAAVCSLLLSMIVARVFNCVALCL